MNDPIRQSGGGTSRELSAANESERLRSQLRHYHSILTEPVGQGRLEGVDAAAARTLTAAGVPRRINALVKELERIVHDYCDNRPDKLTVVQKIAEQGEAALTLLCTSEEALIREPQRVSHLEAIIATDGSRPSFLVRDGGIDFDSSPATVWKSSIGTENLDTILSCTGRIEIGGKLRGTGFRIANHLILTNRHVVQRYLRDGRFTDAATIDFNGEFRSETKRLHRLTRVAFLGPDEIPDGAARHELIDLAAIEFEPPAAMAEQNLSIDASAKFAAGAAYVVGFPAEPDDPDYEPTLLESLFESQYGCKRLAPGRCRGSRRSGAVAWTVAHDATTLGGNSGSALVLAGTSFAVAGLHYGGSRVPPAENWACSLAKLLEAPGCVGLRAVFRTAGVVISPQS